MGFIIAPDFPLKMVQLQGALPPVHLLGFYPLPQQGAMPHTPTKYSYFQFSYVGRYDIPQLQFYTFDISVMKYQQTC